jgi:hypothetical protein
VSNSKKLALIAIGYVLSVVVGFVAAAVNEALMPDAVAQGSPGMVAFGDMILFIFVTGFFSLASSAASVPESVIDDFEVERRCPNAAALDAIRRAFEDVGVVFERGDDVRMRAEAPIAE